MKNSSLWNLLKIILAIALLLFVLSKTNLADLRKTFQNISVPWLMVSVLLFILTTLLKAFQYHILMPKQLSYFQVLNLIIWQNIVSNYLMTGTGVMTYITMTRIEHEVKVSRSLVTFSLTKLGDLTAIWLTLLVSAILLARQIAHLGKTVALLLFIIGLLILAFLLAVFFRQRAALLFAKLLHHSPFSGFTFAHRALDYFQKLTDVDPQKVRSALLKLFSCSLVYLGASIALIYANYATFNFRLAPIQFVFVSTLMQLVSYIPIAVFGGLGITETSSLYLFGIFGVGQASLAPVLIGNRILFYLLNLLPLIYLLFYEVIRQNRRKKD